MAVRASLRERKKAETRAKILACAHRLFHRHGFAETTLEDICAAVAISKRTFFRYFPDKEALVFPNRDMRLIRFVELLDAAPPQEEPFEIFRRVTRMFASEYMQHREALLAQQRLVAGTAELVAREREIDHDWELAIVRTFTDRMDAGAASERRAEVLAGAMIGMVRATMRHWFKGGAKGDLELLGQEALDSLEGGFGVVPLERSKPSAPSKKRASKKRANKKRASKKSASKKSASKKSASKKSASKKSASKKRASKKSPAKKPARKKTAGKRASKPGRAPAKKATRRRSSARA